ncbi:MAG TPA: magnesium transporter [Blastocatellia bacterium]|nr:magnesium transporter [Blastocatellia bacterium]HMV81560.1 magnesium transporter [Blastocatellia bacterium]HMX26446.1 magnesium transporter [Blastocatellia bacterium]HMZ21190.1 magnesium transporter [Blastocatellia bacterium]HNG28509.1 magnesium transporter [Blastocatellia bacterium]
MQSQKFSLMLDSVRRLMRGGATARALNVLRKGRPADVAQVLHALSDLDRKAVFTALAQSETKLAAASLSELSLEEGVALLKTLGPTEIAHVLQELPSDDAALFVAELPEELREQLLDLMKVETSTDVQELLSFAEGTAGRIMTPAVFALNEDLTVGESISNIQSASRDVELVYYLYIVDDRNHLVGVSSLRQLLLVSPTTPLKKIMSTDVISVRTDAPQEEVARVVERYNLLGVPVVDEEHKLVGIVTVDDVLDVIREEATEDIYALSGVSSDEGATSPPLRSVRLRLPWLLVNLATAVLAATVVHSFEATIEKVVVLAALQSIVAGMGGNAATQTLAVIVRGLALGEVTLENSRRVLVKEVLVGVANGLVNGLVAALIVLVWFGFSAKMFIIGGIIAAALMINLVIAAAAGTVIPLVLKRLKADPALASTVFVTTCTDVGGFLSFLGLATLFVKYLK